jgi:hypothetical protein
VSINSTLMTYEPPRRSDPYSNQTVLGSSSVAIRDGGVI